MQARNLMRRAAATFGLTAVVVFASTGSAFAGNASVFVQDGKSYVSYNADPTIAESVTVTQASPNSVTFATSVTPTSFFDPECVVSGNTVTCNVVLLEQITVNLSNLNDTAFATTTVSTTILGRGGDDRIDMSGVSFDNSTAVGDSFGDPEFGNDTIIGSAANLNLYGGLGNDTITGGAGSEYIDGGAGIDALNGGAGDDQMAGGSAGDRGDGSDTIIGGDGSDTVTYAGRAGELSVDLRTDGGDGQADGENDQVSLIENIVGGSAADVLIGNDLENTIDGGPGADRIEGRGDFDVLRGGSGADLVNSAGDITADLIECGNSAGAAPNTDTDTASLDYLDHLAGTADCETVNRAKAPSLAPQFGNNEDNRITGDITADLIFGLRGNDTLLGLANHDELHGGIGNDKLFGGLGSDRLYGGYGNDGISGGDGNDIMEGGFGRDFMLGGPGIDTLFGGPGVDRMDGGAGRDFLVSRDGVRGDVVTCTKVFLGSVAGRLQRDVVVADRGDLVLNARFCARVTYT